VVDETVQLCDEVARLITEAAIAGLGGDPAVEAISDIQPDDELPDLSATKVDVVPGNIDIEPITRDAHKFIYRVDVGIRRRVSSLAERRGMSGLVRDVCDVVRSSRVVVVSLQSQLPIAVAVNPVFDPELLRETGVYFSVIQAQYLSTRRMI